MAESSCVQWLSARLPLAVVSGEGGGTIATLALVSEQVRGTVAMFRLTIGMGRTLLPWSSVIENLSRRTAWMGRELTMAGLRSTPRLELAY